MTHPFVADFQRKRSAYIHLERSLQGLLNQIANANGVNLFRLESRIKTDESLDKKLNRPEKAGGYKDFSSVTDLCGLRMVVLDTDECSKIVQSIRQELIVDELNSIDKRTAIDEDRFGYLSTHLVVSLPPKRTELIEYKNLGGMFAEIQVRTVLQHAWSVLDWNLRYKSDTEVPKELRRKLFRVSALLEAADEVFLDVKNISASLRKKYENEFALGEFRTALSRESLETYIETSDVLKSLLKRCAKMNIAFVMDPLEMSAPLAYLISSLNASGVDNIEQLNNALEKISDSELSLVGEIAEIAGFVFGPYTLIRDLVLSTLNLEMRRSIIEATPSLHRIEAEEQVLLRE